MKEPKFKVGDKVEDENGCFGEIIAHFINPYHCYVVHYAECLYYCSAYGPDISSGCCQRIVWSEDCLEHF